MKLKKYPVYVNGQPYKVTLKEKSDFDDPSIRFFRVKFYTPDRLFYKVSFDIDRSYGGYSNVNYKAIVIEAIKRFEKELKDKQAKENRIKELYDWDGK